MKTISQEAAMRLVAEGAALSPAARHELQQQRLHELVDYVRNHSPYLAELYADLPADYTLADLPPTDKATMLEHYNDWVTDRELTLDRVMQYVNRPVSDTSLLLGKYTALCTSGSTGTPLPMVRDDYHNKIHEAMLAQRLFFVDNPELLDPTRHKVASIIHTSPAASSYNSYLRMIARYPQITDNILVISVLENIDETVRKLNAFQPELISGYASSLLLLAVEKEKGHLDIPVKLITNSAELLTKEAYDRIHAAFQCPVLNNYCMTEGGEIAMTHGSHDLYLNDDWIIVEPMEEGAYITDLTNYVQPIIRYYVNDRVRITPSRVKGQGSKVKGQGSKVNQRSLPTGKSKGSMVNGWDLPILEISGRTFETFTLCGQTFTMVSIVTKAEVWEGLLQWQVVQTTPESMEVRGVCAPDADPHQVLGSLAAQLQVYFRQNGCPAAVFTYSLEPLLFNARGGKIPRYINRQ
jgi:phenylacetate-coenzyme A ligase PaaK-like adenylate-forming protein